jgi:RNA polymerase sigma-70 factor, ECF subfamily
MDNQTEISIEDLRSGNRQAFASLVDAYSGPLHRLALKMVGNEADAEDVLQNTFLKAYTHIHEFEGRSKLSTWLYRIASNEALMLLRKQRPVTTFTDITAQDGEESAQDPVEISDWCCLPEQDFLTSEARATLEQAVQHLPETLRIVFILRDIESLSIQETSQVLGLSESAVKTRLLRARLRLRDDLSHYFGERVNERSEK